MKKLFALMLTGFGFASCLASATYGDLIITEFIADPLAVADTAGEYFELFNNGAIPIDIGTLTIADDGTDSIDLASFAGTFILPNSFVVFGNEPTLNAAHVDVDYSSVGSFTLANGADEIVVIDTASSGELARLSYPDGNAAGAGVANVLNDIANATAGVTLESDYIGEVSANNTLLNGDVGSPGAAGSTIVSAVPEPSSFALLGLTCCAGLMYRRR